MILWSNLRSTCSWLSHAINVFSVLGFAVGHCFKMGPKLAVLLAFLTICFTIARGAPVELTTSQAPVTEKLDCHNENENESSDVYDQRQNGTENYRIHVNGVVVLVAPAETVLQAAQLTNFPVPSETEVSSSVPPVVKPKPKPTSEVADSSSVNQSPHGSMTQDIHKDVKEKNNLKLLNLLQMFRSIKHETEGTVERLN